MINSFSFSYKSDKEYYKIINADYKNNGTFWQYRDIFIDWLFCIDNELSKQLIHWMRDDIKLGFANFYSRQIYLQGKISEPWISDLCWENISLLREAVSFDNPIGIKREDYKNIYSLNMIIVDTFDNTHKNNIHESQYYDLRVQKLNRELIKKDSRIESEVHDLSYELGKEAVIYWQDEASKFADFIDYDNLNFSRYILELHTGILSSENIPDVDDGWQYINWLQYSQGLRIYLMKYYLDGFDYREELSSKQFLIFTKIIDENYQWALCLFGSYGIGWQTADPKLLIIKSNLSKPFKPKDVAYQDHAIFLNNLVHHWKLNTSFEIQVQRAIFINRVIQRHIKWMQDRVMKVIYDV